MMRRVSTGMAYPGTEEQSSEESWDDDSDHYELMQDSTWRELRDKPGARRERKQYRRKFLTDRREARKKEVLKQFIDTQKVGICVDNPHLMSKSGYQLLEKINKNYGNKTAQDLLQSSLSSKIFSRMSFSQRSDHLRNFSNKIIKPGPNEYAQVCTNLDHQRNVFQQQMATMEQMQKDSLVQRIQEKLKDRRQQMKNQKNCRVKATFQGHAMFRQMIFQQNAQQQTASKPGERRGSTSLMLNRSQTRRGDTSNEKMKLLKQQQKHIPGKVSEATPERKKSTNLTINITKLLAQNRKDENQSPRDSSDDEEEGAKITHPKSPQFKAAQKRKMFKQQLGNLATLDHLHNTVYHAQESPNQMNDGNEQQFSSIKLLKTK